MHIQSLIDFSRVYQILLKLTTLCQNLPQLCQNFTATLLELAATLPKLAATLPQVDQLVEFGRIHLSSVLLRHFYCNWASPVTDNGYCIILSLFLAINSSLGLLNIYIIYLQNSSYNKNMYYTFQLIVVKPFSYISVRQGLNYVNTLPNKNNPVQAIYFITVSSFNSLLVILILIYIKNPLSLYGFSTKYLTDSILINQ